MRILVLNYEFPPLGGGASPIGHEIAKRYVSRGDRVTLVTMGYKDLLKEEAIDGINVIRVPSFRSRKEICRIHEMLSYVLSAIWFLRTHLKKNSYDVSHTHFIIPTGIISWWMYKKFSIPYIITLHGSDVPGYNKDRFALAHRLTPPIIRMVAKHAKKLIFPSRFLKELFEQNASDEMQNKSMVIPNGINPNEFQPSEKKNYILATGRLLPRKGFQHLIGAVTDEDIGYEVHIAGDGPMKEKLEAQASKSKTKIVFHGWLNNKSEEYKSLLENAAIYALPSSCENSSVALLEAMNAGCAVISTNISGCPETVGDAGILVSSEQPNEIKDAIGRLTENTKMLHDYQHRARIRIKEAFDWELLVDSYQQTLEQAD